MTIDTAVLYPTMASETQPADETQSAEVPQDTAEAPRSRSTAEIAASFYDLPAMYKDEMNEALTSLADEGVPSEKVEMLRQVAPKLFVALAFNNSEARDFANLYAKHAREPVSDDQMRDWNRQTRRQIRERYGEDAGNRVEQAKRMLDRLPNFKAMLSKTRLGSHPELVLSLIERAPRVLARG